MSAGSVSRMILIIDDDALLCDTVKDAFSSETLVVLTAHSAAGGMEVCRATKIDVVILD